MDKMQAKKIPLEEPLEKALTPHNADMRNNVPIKDLEKFREVLLYILSKIGEKPNVGETVLYKLLYFIDFDFYEMYGEQMIGATYRKNTFGPTPIEFPDFVRDMIEKKEVQLVKRKLKEKIQKRYVPLREPKSESLSDNELKIIDDVLARLSHKNARQISDYSHGDIPWAATGDMEIIEYEAAFYRTPEYSVRPDEYDEVVC